MHHTELSEEFEGKDVSMNVQISALKGNFFLGAGGKKGFCIHMSIYFSIRL